MDKEYDPANEQDPADLARQQIELGRELLKEIRSGKKSEAQQKAQADLARLRVKLEEAGRAPSPPVGALVYHRPTVSDVLAKAVSAWNLVQNHFPGAPTEIQYYVFQGLLHAAADEPEELQDPLFPPPDPGSEPLKGPPEPSEGKTA